MTAPVLSPTEAAQGALAAELAEVRAHLERHAGRRDAAAGPESATAAVPRPRAGGEAPAGAADGPLDRLSAIFGLSAFERRILVLCAGVELDAAFAAACAAARGDATLTEPTFGLALAALPDAHWSALAPAGPLRHWRLLEVVQAGRLVSSPLRIDERVLHHLVGVDQLDERLSALAEPVQTEPLRVPSHQAVAERLARAWAAAADSPAPPALQLWGADPASRRAVAAAAAARLGLRLWAVAAEHLPGDPRELDALARLWERDVVLGGNALLLDGDGVDTDDPRARAAIGQAAETAGVAVVTSTKDRRQRRHRRSLAFEVRHPTSDEQHQLWRTALEGTGGSDVVDDLVGQFDLTAPAIAEACAEVIGPAGELHDGDSTPGRVAAELWEACRTKARPALGELAQRIEPAATWDDLVLPAPQRGVLGQLALHVRHRVTVYERWRLGRGGARGLGTTALFVGPSGTGKTLAAEVLAGDLRLDLYRIDLSQVVSKYIGETEKNLRRVFDAAEAGGAVLLFDEADALFGKRSEVRDSHDRYANIEVSYLLQRMEAYRGLAILTTNAKEALDPAFLRRIRFVVSFPFPDASLRADIWRRVFPPEAPTVGLEPERLGRLNLAGGSIRNIAVNAAFLAAEADQPIGMGHLAGAARAEYAKLEKPLSTAELAGLESGGPA